jgi:hypothetical protein
MEYVRLDAFYMSAGMTLRTVKRISLHLGLLKACLIIVSVILSALVRIVTMITGDASVRLNVLQR